MRANLWDLETVPDLGGFAAANDLVGKSDGEPLKRRELACKRLASIGLRRSRHLRLGLASRHLLQIPRRRGASLSTKFTTN